MLRAASDGLVAPPGLLDRPSDLSQLGVNAVVGSRPLPQVCNYIAMIYLVAGKLDLGVATRS